MNPPTGIDRLKFLFSTGESRPADVLERVQRAFEVRSGRGDGLTPADALRQLEQFHIEEIDMLILAESQPAQR